MVAFPEDTTAHEIIILSRSYHLSIHFPQGSLYADVWLGINSGYTDLLVHISELRRKALDTTPLSEISHDNATSADNRRDSLHSNCSSVDNPSKPQLDTRHATHGLCNCPVTVQPQDWMMAKESLAQAQSMCGTHHAKFCKAIEKMQGSSTASIPDLQPLRRLMDELYIENDLHPGSLDSPTCCICSASPYTRLFFSML